MPNSEDPWNGHAHTMWLRHYDSIINGGKGSSRDPGFASIEEIEAIISAVEALRPKAKSALFPASQWETHSMTETQDIVNAWFRRFYPTDLDRHTQFSFRGGHRSGWQYTGPRTRDRIFPHIVCKDGFTISVQGHYGAYCYPCDDFCEDAYETVEVMCPLEDTLGNGREQCGEEYIYPFVPLTDILRAIEAHGGFDEAASLAKALMQ